MRALVHSSAATAVVMGGWVLLAVLAVTVIDDPVVATVVANLAMSAVWVTLSALRPGWNRFDPAPSSGRPGVVWVVLAVLGAFALGQVLGRLAYVQVGSPAYDQQLATREQSAAWLVLLLGVLIAPLAEELVLRGTLYPVLRRHVGIVVSGVLTCGVFATLHGNLFQILIVLPFSVVLVVIYERTRSVWWCVAVHVVFNVLARLVPGSVLAWVTGPVQVVALLIVFVVLLARLITAGASSASSDQDPEAAAGR